VWFPLDPCELDFCGRSPRRIVNEAVLPLDAARAFELIASGEELGAWLQDFVSCTWTSPAPHGVGSTRDVKLQLLSVTERFIAWQPGERLAFTMTGTTLPVFSRALEDMQLTALAPDRTRLRWTVHYDVPAWGRLIHPVTHAVFDQLLARSAVKLTRHAGQWARGSSR
jgi:hypothetical protein